MPSLTKASNSVKLNFNKNINPSFRGQQPFFYSMLPLSSVSCLHGSVIQLKKQRLLKDSSKFYWHGKGWRFLVLPQLYLSPQDTSTFAFLNTTAMILRRCGKTLLSIPCPPVPQLTLPRVDGGRSAYPTWPPHICYPTSLPLGLQEEE